MTPPIRRARLLTRAGALAVSAPLLFAACSDDAATGGEGLIERRLADEIGLGELDADCESPAEQVAGETFSCTATTTDGRTIEFHGEMTDGDALNIVTTNLLTLKDLDALREDAAASLGAANDLEIAADDIDCGDEPIILTDVVFMCELTDVTDGSVYELEITTAPFEPGVGIRSTYYRVGDQLR